ncbi:beta-ketoacyl-[acyl-carrier-protein] synthase family protein [Piscinibacter terrae]|uniref:Nodulation protein E n=1 Tax=Piscinibacter terrae TaxID=2496871 RepID=A0A3N7HNT5_9BURK|nr:beta-ketoacyl-[acyl-carrier-protein] synthase family protein [Albitalea terrae]RQP23780.1 beta-ketoacyl-[acyl-carrier-protein] synthase family protein [Albitalea terrae]
MRAKPSRIAVTGLGLVSPLGDNVDAAWQRLMRGEGAVRRMSFEGLPDIAAASVDFDPATVLTKLQQVGTERVSQMALSAAARALEDAGLSEIGDGERVGLYVGTGLGGASTIDTGYAAMYGGTRVPPLTVPAGMVNGPAAVIAMHCGILGPVVTYAVACASSSVAIAEAAHALRRGEVDVAIAGGAEALLVRGTVAAWQALRTLAPPRADDVQGSCRPFSADRNGLVLGEGAAFLVLRREEDLAEAQREPHAWLVSSAVRCDAAHLTNPNVRGQVAALQAALRSAQLLPSDIGYCNAHGTATVAGDPVECEALRQVWGDSAARLHVSSTKAAHGHLLGGAGALEALLTVMALRRQEIPPTRGVHDLDPACTGLRHVLGEGVPASNLGFAVSNSFAFGGTNSTLVFARA